MRYAAFVCLALVVVFLVGPLARSEESELDRADALFESKNYREAATAYDALIASAKDAAVVRHASRRSVMSQLRLQLFDAAIEAAEAYVERTAGTPYQARAHRFAGNLWLNVPHWGTRAGGTFHRAVWMQGMQVRSWRHDKVRAVAHLEQARDLYAAWDEGTPAGGVDDRKAAEKRDWRAERLENLFDLAGACARFGIYENEWMFWWGFWAERDDFAAETAGEDDFDEYYGDWQLQRKRPIGLRLGADGKPSFPSKPDAYAVSLDDDQKILYLFDEVRALDTTEDKRPSGLSYYRQAMLARSRFGMDRLNGIAGMYRTDRGNPLQEDLESLRPWELEDDQALILAGGRIQVVALPPEWDVEGLLHVVTGDYEASGLGPQAQYALGLHKQTRQQYREAVETYQVIAERWPDDKRWRESAREQVSRILKIQVHVNQTGVQYPGEPARIQISYRNALKIHFVARRIDLAGFFASIRNQSFAELRGPKDVWSLSNWHAWFVQPWNEDSFARKVARKSVGEVVARWADHVEDDGTHRFATATLQTPLDQPGAYLVEAHITDPEEVEGKIDPLLSGVSRAVVVMTDLALVEKRVKTGRLVFVADARTGAPIEGATLDMAEFWSRWDQKLRKSRHYRALWQRTTDAKGLSLDPLPKRDTGQVHVVASVGEGANARLAWSGMQHWQRYHPSRVQSGSFAWVATDRPVYRPGQTVRFKSWIRRREAGQFVESQPESWTIRIHDSRGNEVYKANGRTDAYGGFDGQFTLEEEPTLGVYRIHVQGVNVMGGQNFRVEEYKKPEFEVKVEPDQTHAKLGETVKATIRADYYFGAPVSDGEVRYKVFREEYRHTYYAPGRWDWLYGPGYGYAWYDSNWFPWWGDMLCCRVAPEWWWGYSMAPAWARWSRGVRELVKEGEGRIGADGTFAVEIDTSGAARDHGDLDHRYVVEAEVRDASRRVITGEGSVKVTRQAFYALLTPQRGWYRPGEEIDVALRCLTPDNRPLAKEGIVTVTEVKFGGPQNAEIRQTELDRFKVETDERGEAKLKVRFERSGQLRISFESVDAWGGVVKGHALVWVCGEDFEGRLHRFNDLELITDKRTYAPGETAHVLVNTKRSDSWVLFSPDVDSGMLMSWDMLHLDGRSKVVDVPVKQGSVPNFFVEATTVADMRVHQQTKRICVPPTEGVIDVSVETDQSEYEAGAEAVIRVKATKPDGNPAQAQVTLSAFDRSVLYIQPELTAPIQSFFHGRVRRHVALMSTNLLEQFSSWGGVMRPYQAIYPIPPGWRGTWGPTVGDWREVGDEVMESWGADKEASMGEGQGDAGVADPCCPPAPTSGAPTAPGSPPGMISGATRDTASRRLSGVGGGAAGAAKGGVPAFAEATVRKAFADTALWETALVTGPDGTVETKVRMPENLTTWKINVWGMTKRTQVGQASTSCVTTKNLIVRLQAPRFFMEYDEVVLSANVHNYLDEAKTARVTLEVPAELLDLFADTPATVDVEVAAGGETRVDWRVKVVKEGHAKILVKALTDEESDAVEMGFPVLVHGMMKQVATTGSMRPDENEKTLVVELDVPDKRRPELTRLEVQYAPSLVGSMLDALPYCLEYPYGCTEQTVSRFLPAVLTLKTLQQMGIKLSDVKGIRGRMAEIKRIREGEGYHYGGAYAENPVFDDEKMARIIKQGLARIAKMQNGDGGWGWWTRDRSSPYLTAYVLYALLSARDADIGIDDGMIQRGSQFLVGWSQGRMMKKTWAPSEHQAFVAYVLSLAKVEVKIAKTEGDERPIELLARLWVGRDKLNLYGKSLLSLAHANVGEADKAKTVLRNILQYVEQNEETQVAWLRTPTAGWWYWWNNDIETNAWFLRALVKVDPKSDLAPRIVKWLLNNRRNGYYWRSTRDTTLCVAAMSDFVIASGEGTPDFTLRLELDDGQVVKEVKISKENFFSYDNRFVVEGVALSGGKHTLKVTKTGPGALYFNTYLSYFTKEEHITAAGHELKVDRRYFLLKRIPYEVEVEGAEGQKLKEKRLRYERVPLADGDAVVSGDLIQVELEVTSDNDYTFLAFEDMKPAGCEPVELRSGGEGQEGFWSYMELRDEKVCFFVRSLEQGKHLLRYRLRAEIPGTFHALPSKLFAMYVPELKANAEEMLLKIQDPD